MAAQVIHFIEIAGNKYPIYYSTWAMNLLCLRLKCSLVNLVEQYKAAPDVDLMLSLISCGLEDGHLRQGKKEPFEIDNYQLSQLVPGIFDLEKVYLQANEIFMQCQAPGGEEQPEKPGPKTSKKK